MGIYQEFEMLTLGNVPTVKIEVPVSIPTPFFPEWVFWLIGILVVVGGVFIYLWLRGKKENTKNVAEIEWLKQEDLKKSEELKRFGQKTS